jgi:hypothetical protein
MIVEIRTYKVKPGLRDRFVRFFEEEAAPVQRKTGMVLLGPFIDLGSDDTVVCLRGFPTHQDREQMRTVFYKSPEWTGRLRPQAVELVESYKVMVAETGIDTFQYK